MNSTDFKNLKFSELGYSMQSALGQFGWNDAFFPYINLPMIATQSKISNLVTNINISLMYDNDDDVDEEQKQNYLILKEWKEAIEKNNNFYVMFCQALVQATINGASIIGFDITWQDIDGKLWNTKPLQGEYSVYSIDFFVPLPNYNEGGIMFNYDNTNPLAMSFYRRVMNNKFNNYSALVYEIRTPKYRQYYMLSPTAKKYPQFMFFVDQADIITDEQKVWYKLITATDNFDSGKEPRDYEVNDVMLLVNKRERVAYNRYQQLSDFWGKTALEWPVYNSIERLMFEMVSNTSKVIGRVDSVLNQDANTPTLSMGQVAQKLGMFGTTKKANSFDVLQRAIVFSEGDKSSVEVMGSSYNADAEFGNLTQAINLYVKETVGVDLGLTSQGTQMVTGQVTAINNAWINTLASQLEWYKQQLTQLLNNSLIICFGRQKAKQLKELWSLDISGNLLTQAIVDNTPIINAYNNGLLSQLTAIMKANNISNFSAQKELRAIQKQKDEDLKAQQQLQQMVPNDDEDDETTPEPNQTADVKGVA